MRLQDRQFKNCKKDKADTKKTEDKEVIQMTV